MIEFVYFSIGVLILSLALVVLTYVIVTIKELDT